MPWKVQGSRPHAFPQTAVAFYQCHELAWKAYVHYPPDPERRHHGGRGARQLPDWSEIYRMPPKIPPWTLRSSQAERGLLRVVDPTSVPIETEMRHIGSRRHIIPGASEPSIGSSSWLVVRGGE